MNRAQGIEHNSETDQHNDTNTPTRNDHTFHGLNHLNIAPTGQSKRPIGSHNVPCELWKRYEELEVYWNDDVSPGGGVYDGSSGAYVHHKYCNEDTDTQSGQ